MTTTADAPPADPVSPAPLPRWLLAGGVALVVLLGVGLRFVSRSDLWLDEALSVNIARLPLGDLRAALEQDGAPPLYYVLLHAWTAVFGTGDLAVRSLSGVLGVAALPAAWFAGRRLGGPVAGTATGWAAVVLLASSPYAIRYSSETRMYSLVVLLVLLGHLALVRALERPNPARLAAVALVTAALAYTQYWCLYLLAAVGVLLVGMVVRDRSRRAALLVLGAMAVGGLLFLPWLPTFLSQLESTGTPWGAAILPPTVFGTSIQEFAGGDYSEGWLLVFPLVLVTVLGVFGRARGPLHVELDLRTRPETRVVAAVAVGALLLGAALSYVAGSAFQARYAAIVFPLLVLVAAFGTLAFGDLRIRAGVLAVLAVLGLLGGFRAARDATRTQAGAVAAVLNAEARAGDVLVLCPDQLGPSVARLLRDDVRDGMRVVVYPSLAPPERVDWVDYEERVRAADPVAVAAEVAELAGPTGTVWYDRAPGYRTHAGVCEAFEDALRPGRVATQRVLADDEYFEPHGLLQLAPAP